MEKNLKRVVLGVIYCTAFFLLIVLSSPAHSQSFEWVKLLGTTAEDEGYGVAVDPSGNIYVTGTTEGDLGGQKNMGENDAFLAKYNSSGTMQWVRQLGSAADDDGYGVAVDTSDNIYITGDTDGDLGGKNVGSWDCFLAKYNSSGTMQWVRQLGSAAGDDGHGVAVDTSDNIYITGDTDGDLGGKNVGSWDCFLAKYNSSGTMQWVKQLGSAADDYGWSVAADTSGNIYVTGTTDGDLGGETNVGGWDAFLAKYDSSGTMHWVKLLGTTADDEANGVAVDTSGNIYITGYTDGDLGGENNAGGDDAFLAKYDSSGTMHWVKLLGTTAEDEGYGVAADTSGNIYITGDTGGDLGGENNAGNDDAFLAKYDSSGMMQWVKLLGTASNDWGQGVAIDISGNIYITGWTTGSLGGKNAGRDDIFLAKYGSFPWEIFYPAFIKKK